MDLRGPGYWGDRLEGPWLQADHCSHLEPGKAAKQLFNVTLVKALFPVLDLLNFGLDEDHSPVQPLCSSTKVSR